MTKDEAIRLLHNASNEYGNVIIDFLDAYKLAGLNDATIEQLTEYIAKHKLKG